MPSSATQFKKGNGGRPKGTPNRLGKTAKENIAKVFEDIGGTEALAKWARKNPTQFYLVYAKLLPLQVGDEDGGGLNVIIQQFTPVKS